MDTSQKLNHRISVARLIDFAADEREGLVIIYQGASGHVYREPAFTLLKEIGMQQLIVRDKNPDDPYPNNDLMGGSFEYTVKDGCEYDVPTVCKEAVELFLSVFYGEVQEAISRFYGVKRSSGMGSQKRDPYSVLDPRIESIQRYIDLLNDELREISSSSDERYEPPPRELMWEQEGLGLMYEDDRPSQRENAVDQLEFQRKARQHNMASFEAEIAKAKEEMGALERTRASYRLLDLDSPIRKRFARGELQKTLRQIIHEQVPLEEAKPVSAPKIRRIANILRADNWEVSDEAVRVTLRKMGFYRERKTKV